MIFINNFKFITADNIAPEVNRLTENIAELSYNLDGNALFAHGNRQRTADCHGSAVNFFNKFVFFRFGNLFFLVVLFQNVTVSRFRLDNDAFQ